MGNRQLPKGTLQPRGFGLAAHQVLIFTLSSDFQLRKRFEVHIGGSRWVTTLFGGLTSRQDYEKLQKLFDESPLGNIEAGMKSVLETIEVSYKWIERDGQRIAAWLDEASYYE